jgi:DNA-binding response OmpR family regulator
MRAETRPLCILVADDDPEILSLLSVRLKDKGYRVLEASDGVQTLQQARDNRPDLIVLDVMMPGKNGWEVAKELRHDPETRDIGIVVLTALGENINEMTSPIYGADAFLDKPFEFATLEAKIRDTLARRQSADR